MIRESTLPTAGRRGDRVQPAPFWERPAFYWALLAVNAAAVLAFWYSSSGFEALRSSADTWNAIGRATGLMGTYLALWQLLLMGRIPWLDDAFGMERLDVLHRWNAFAVVGLLLVHGVAQTIGYMLTSHRDLLSQVGQFVVSYEGLPAAIVALFLMVGVVAGSVWIGRRKLSYETWYFIHLYTYIAILLAFSHQLATGVDFAGNPAFVFYWCALYGLVVVSLLLHRVAWPLFSYDRHRFRVSSLQREAPGVWSVYIGGRRMEEIAVRPGQFGIWRFLDRRRWWQAHPFTISALPDGRRLRLTARSIGDFTRDLAAVKVGTPVMLEGPFGRFTPDERTPHKVLLLAGGVGITPLRPIAEDLAKRGHDVRLLYRAHAERDVIFRAELDRLERELGVEVDYLFTQGSAEQRKRSSLLAAPNLRRLVPDVAECEVYVCGPPAMRKVALRSLRELGVPGSRIRTEVFRF